MKSYILYAHIVPNSKLYIGITCQAPVKRWGVNGEGYFNGKRKNQLPFYNAILKYGWDNIQHIILLENLSQDVANECEKYLIKKYCTNNPEYGYNLTEGGGGLSGFTHSEETCMRLSESLTGRKLSDEHKQHISDGMIGNQNTWQKGVPLSDITKQKISNSLMGHSVSEETKEKIRVANIGKHATDETRLKQSINNGMHRPEIRKKVSESLKKSGKDRAQKRLKTIKEKYPNGMKQSEESNKKRSEALKGVPKSDATRQKMRKPKSPEAVEHMRLAQIRSHEAKRLGITYKEYLERIGGRQ